MSAISQQADAGKICRPRIACVSADPAVSLRASIGASQHRFLRARRKPGRFAAVTPEITARRSISFGFRNAEIEMTRK